MGVCARVGSLDVVAVRKSPLRPMPTREGNQPLWVLSTNKPHHAKGPSKIASLVLSLNGSQPSKL